MVLENIYSKNSRNVLISKSNVSQFWQLYTEFKNDQIKLVTQKWLNQ